MEAVVQAAGFSFCALFGTANGSIHAVHAQ